MVHYFCNCKPVLWINLEHFCKKVYELIVDVFHKLARNSITKIDALV